jgi:plastocyanin
MPSRRRFLESASAALATAALAGCSANSGGGDQTTDAATTGGGETTSTSGDSGVTADAAVAAQWNVYRARLADAAALGTAADAETGARIAAGVFEDFEAASGQHGAHEKLEATSESHYEGFESAAVELRDALANGEATAARERQRSADDHLAAAQRELVGDTVADALDVLAFGDRAATTADFATAGRPDVSAVEANAALTDFEDAPAHDALESAAADAYETFESALGDVLSAGQRENAEATQNAATEALSAAVEGAYAVAGERAVSAGQAASFQARAYDAAAIDHLGGPATSFAHARTLAGYRARLHDAVRLAGAGETDAAATMALDVLKHFEGAEAHEPLEEANHEAYEGFEGGVKDLQSAIEDGSGVDEALTAVDASLVEGVKTLATGTEAAVLEAGFFRARLADARERYRGGDQSGAAALAESLFERFETNELGVHETLESTSESLYETFEHEHLEPLPAAMRDGDDEAVATHLDGALGALLDFETAATSTARVSGAESAYIGARAFDAATLASAGDRERAAAVADAAMAHFESGAGGFHEAIEHADESAYHSFEKALVAVSDAASSGADAYATAQTFGDEAIGATYTVVAAAGGELGAAAADVVRNAVSAFETSRVHETLEEADHDAYEAFEGAFGDYASALESGGSVSVPEVARASVRAQFAVVGAVDSAPVGEFEDSGGEKQLSGGPDVVSGVPENADHVVDMNAVAYDPAELTVTVGDTVAWKHSAGEPHTVTAYEDELPEGAAYWASGGFDSESDARSGWENGKGAVTEGQSFVHTFETAGTHEYVCIPHETLDMVGTVVVEE